MVIDYMEYGLVVERFVAYRKKQNLIQKNVADIVDISQSEYSKLELGKEKIPYKILSKLYRHGWDIDMVVTGEAVEPLIQSIQNISSQCDEREFISALKLCEWAIERWSQDRTSNEPIGNKLLKIFVNDDSGLSQLEKLRKAFGVSQLQMAEIVGVNIKKYRALEKGRAQLDAELMANIYEATKCKPSYFMDENAYYLSVVSDECRQDKKRETQLNELLEIRDKFTQK